MHAYFIDDSFQLKIFFPTLQYKLGKHHHRHHVVPSARISLTLLSPPLPIVHCFHRVFRATSRIYTKLLFEMVVLPLLVHVKVQRSTLFMSSTLLLRQYPACLVRIILIVFVIGGLWPYICCFVGCCPPGILNYCSLHSCVVTVKVFLHLFC